MVSPVAGLTVGNVLPETLSCHLPPMNSGWSLTHLRQFAVVFEGQDAFFPWFFEDGTADLENIVPR